MTATEVFLDQLRDGGGRVVNISSVAGRTARAGNAAYAATAITANDITQIIAFAVSRGTACRSTRSSSAPPPNRTHGS